MVSAMPLFLPHILIKILVTSHFKKYLCHKENQVNIMTSLNSGQEGHFKHKCKKKKRINKGSQF